MMRAGTIDDESNEPKVTITRIDIALWDRGFETWQLIAPCRIEPIRAKHSASDAMLNNVNLKKYFT